MKNIFITGASQGIGKALAFEYASHGCNLVICSRNVSELKKICEEINNNDGSCNYTTCDVSKLHDVANAVNFAIAKLGKLDLAILNSGIGFPQWIGEFKSEIYKQHMEVNAFGIAHALEVLIPVMKKQGFGTIAGVTSMADVRGYTGSSSYVSSKGAASLLLESARVELKEYNIRVITVRPGFVKTAMTDKNEFYMPMLMSTQKAAKKIRRGIEKGRSVVQFPWPIVWSTRIIKNIPNWIFDWGVRLSRPPKTDDP
jgi:NAD(P)-dependent dehydrogenase (short-subunit alcohol dehydrogenase family)